jgi:tetratricopeptide (TPR) repeat protein
MAIPVQPSNEILELYRGAIDHHKHGRPLEAIAIYDYILAKNSSYAEVYNNRGAALSDVGRYDEALLSFHQAISIKPELVRAHLNLGTVLERLGRDHEALDSYHHAVALDPENITIYLYLGYILVKLDRHVEALRNLDCAIAIDPLNAIAQFDKAVLLLRWGDYATGLELYEWRWKAKQRFHKYPQPQWRGESIQDKTILLHVEQGFGDNIQMLRYVPLVKARAAHVIVIIHEEIRPLLDSMIDGDITVVGHDSPLPSFDLQCPLMSLPLAFGTRIDSIPAQIPYLSPPTERIPRWRTRLPPRPSLRVGLAWSGRSTNWDDHNRSVTLDNFEQLLRVEGISFISLQREYRARDLPLCQRLPIERIDDALVDFGDTAAAIQQCDLVIAVDTAVAHLAGALGKPVWLLLPHVADWRWLRNRTSSPWYPTARLFQQNRAGDWSSVVSTIAKELTIFQRIAEHSGTSYK